MKTNAVLEKGKHEAIKRHLSTLKHLSKKVNRMRLDVEMAKLEAKEEITALQEWNDWFDAKLEKADSDVERVTSWLDNCRKEKEAHAQEQKLHFKAKLHQTRLDMQAELGPGCTSVKSCLFNKTICHHIGFACATDLSDIFKNAPNVQRYHHLKLPSSGPRHNVTKYQKSF